MTYALQGATDLVLRLRPDPARPEDPRSWRGEGTAELTAAGFAADDGSRVAQGLTARREVQ